MDLKKAWGQWVGRAKEVKAGVAPGSGLKPILSLESRLALPKLRQLVEHLEKRYFPADLKGLQGKTVLEVGEEPLPFQQEILAEKPKVACGVVIGEGNLPQIANGGIFLLRGAFRHIPFENHFFDFVLFRLTTPQQGDLLAGFRELGRVMAPEATALITDFHPFGLFAKSGTERLRSVQSAVRGLEDYFRMCQSAGLAVLDLHEGFMDETVRQYFTSEEELKIFRELKGTPLLLYLKVVRQRRK